jgi:hypothetical protein
VNYATADGTATVADGDYQAVSGTLTFAAGEQSKTVTVLVNGDLKVENDETFLVNLSDARLGGQASAQVSIADSQGIGVIVNDDSASFSINEREPGGRATAGRRSSSSRSRCRPRWRLETSVNLRDGRRHGDGGRRRLWRRSPGR